MLLYMAVARHPLKIAAGRYRTRIGALILALAIAFVAGGAVAHELDHQLHKHDLPCALHFYAGHLDGIATSGVALPTALNQPREFIALAPRVVARRPIAPYAVRAPPFSL